MKYIVYLIIVIITFFLIHLEVKGMELSDIMFWKSKEVIVEEVKQIKTIDSEITRLSVEYKVDEKLVRAIIKCESSMYGSAINHNKINGVVWSSDFGLMQINDFYHENTMTKLGFDIHNEFDSLKYGIILLSTQGTSPWNASKFCWENEIK